MFKCLRLYFRCNIRSQMLLDMVFIEFIYLTSMIKVVNNTNKDRLMPHLWKNIELHKRS